MVSSFQPKADLGELAQRLRGIAEALKSLPAGHLSKLDALREEVQAVAKELRGR